MTQNTPEPTYPSPQPVAPAFGTQPPQTFAAPVPAYGGPVPAYGGPMQAYGAPAATGAPGKIRSTGVCMLLSIVTLGFYTWYWYYSIHQEMKNHSGQGLGGAVALLLAVFVGIASPFIASAEVGGLYQRAGRAQPVSGATGLWYLPGIFILVGPIVWFVKTNGALNAYWRSVGATN